MVWLESITKLMILPELHRKPPVPQIQCQRGIATELLPLNYWHRYNLVVRLSPHGQSLGQMADGQELVQTWSSTLQEKPCQCLDQSVLYNSIMPPPSEKDFAQDKR